MTSSQTPLQVAIVGAGIAGLAAAISLRNAGHEVTVYEKYPWTKEGKILSPLGNGMAMGANTARIIDSWGFDFKKAKTTPTFQERIFNGEKLELMQELNFEYTKEETGYDWNTVTRVRLHGGLLEIAQNTPNDSLPIQINTGQEVIGLDCETGTLTLKDGTKITKDLVVVADGVHSKLIDSITNGTTPPMKPTKTAYRFEIPAVKVMQDPLLKAHFENEKKGFSVYLIPQLGIYFLLGEGDEGERFYGILMHPAIESRDGSEKKWDVKGSKAELCKLAEAFHPVVRRLCDLSENTYLWTINCRDPVKSCTNGKAVAIGDACHPHLPHHGQGGASGFEDAASLSVFFDSKNETINPNSVPSILKQWESFRLPRVKTVQLISMTYPTPIESIEPRIREEFNYHGSLPENVKGHEKPINMWLFKYDVVKEAKEYRNKNGLTVSVAG